MGELGHGGLGVVHLETNAREGYPAAPQTSSGCEAKELEKWKLHCEGHCHPCVAFALKAGGCWKGAPWMKPLRL